MKKQINNSEQLIYLDIDYISSLYESVKKEAIVTAISKTQGGRASVGLGIANAGVQATETKQFKVSTLSMFNELKKSLNKYPFLETKPKDNSQLFWIEGELRANTVRSNTTQNNQIIHTDEGRFFFIRGEIIDVALVTSSHYFTINYSPIINFIPQMQKEFFVKVKCLLKLVSENKQYSGALQGEFLAVPLIMLEIPTTFDTY